MFALDFYFGSGKLVCCGWIWTGFGVSRHKKGAWWRYL